jgi:hypothetical protein
MQENIRSRGQGVVLATDHSVFHSGINDLTGLLGLSPFSTPATRHPSLSLTSSADFRVGANNLTSADVVADAVVLAAGGLSPPAGSWNNTWSFVEGLETLGRNLTNWAAVTWNAAVPLNTRLVMQMRAATRENSPCGVFTTFVATGQPGCTASPWCCNTRFTHVDISNGTLLGSRSQFFQVGSLPPRGPAHSMPPCQMQHGCCAWFRCPASAACRPSHFLCAVGASVGASPGVAVLVHQVRALLSALASVDRNTLQLLDVQVHFNRNPQSAYVPVDEAHVLVTTPNFASLTPAGEFRDDIVSGRTFQNYLWGDVATGPVPFGRQPNGLTLFAVAFHSAVNAPVVSSTISGSVNLVVAISAPACGSRVSRSVCCVRFGTCSFAW